MCEIADPRKICRAADFARRGVLRQLWAGRNGVCMNRNACPAANLSGGRERPPYNIRHTGGKTGSGGLPQPLCRGWRLRGRTRFRRLCRAGVFARRLGFAPSQGFRDDTSTAARRRRFGAQCTKCRLLARRSSPTKHRAGFCRALQDISAARRQCTPQSAPCGALPVCGTRIIRRMLKHACILRPLHLLRLAVSAAGGGGVRCLALPLSFRAAAAPA